MWPASYILSRRNWNGKMAKCEPHCCIDCANAKVFQFDYDPIIAECLDGQRYVARYPIICGDFVGMEKLDKKGKRFIRCIENRPKKIGI